MTLDAVSPVQLVLLTLGLMVLFWKGGLCVRDLSLRDYFAGQYLNGRAARNVIDDDAIESVAGGAYAIADAMLKARG